MTQAEAERVGELAQVSSNPASTGHSVQLLRCHCRIQVALCVVQTHLGNGGQTVDFTAAYGYHPIEGDVEVFASGRAVGRLLLVGDTSGMNRALSKLTGICHEVRMEPQPSVDLPRGLYWFLADATDAMVVVTSAPHVDDLVVAQPTLPDGHPLAEARGWMEHWWATGRPLPRPAFELMEEVVVATTGEVVTIRGRVFSSGQWMYEARIDGLTKTVGEQAIRTVPAAGGPAAWILEPPVAPERFSATLTRAKLRDRFTDTVFSFRATKTLFRSYQFKPIMKLLQTGRSRLLIADEVGLGKTIEAGLVWTELEARRSADRVLVVCPSVLIPKWKSEMGERFGFELVELDGPGLDAFLEKVSTGRLPSRVAYIASLQRLRAWSGLSEAADFAPNFDLVIVDEAHAMRNMDTASFALGSILSEWAQSLIFLTATPVNLRSRDLYSLVRLLVPGELGDEGVFEMQLEPNAVLHGIQVSLFDHTATAAQRLEMLERLGDSPFGTPLLNRPEARLLRELLSDDALTPSAIARARRLLLELNTTSAVVTRTRKAEVQEDKSVREPRRIDVSWNPVERHFYREYLGWCQARAELAGTPLGFSMQMPLRLASSCLPAAAAQVRDWTPGGLSQEDGDYGMVAGRSESQQLSPHAELLQAAAALGDLDTKLERLIEAIGTLVESRRQILLFTFSRATLEYLARCLEGQVRVSVLHGGVDKRTRHQVMADFRSGAYDIVLATRVASEGLDFEFCSALINYDLPWNPMEVEQRIGRLDRIGQKEEKIVVVNFHTPDTIESQILTRILERIGVFERSIGELEPIIEDRWHDLRRAAFDFSLTEEQRAFKAEQVLAAIETQGLNREDLEAAADHLLSSDETPIAGMEDDLMRTGRYVGQRELALLLDDWSRVSGGRPAHIDDTNGVIRFRGVPAMAKHVESLVNDGERTRAEVAEVAAAMRSEMDLFLALDPEVSRTTGLDLLTASHPLTRAAVRTAGHEQGRFASVRLVDLPDGIDAGSYLVLVAVATWTGLRPSREVWTSAVTVDGGEISDGVGDALFAAVASGAVRESDVLPGDLGWAVRRATDRLIDRQVAEESDRRSVNDALIDARRASIETVHRRKLLDIDSRRSGLAERGDDRMARLFDGQLKRERERFGQVLSELEDKARCGLATEPLAVCLVEVPK